MPALFKERTNWVIGLDFLISTSFWLQEMRNLQLWYCEVLFQSFIDLPATAVSNEKEKKSKFPTFMGRVLIHNDSMLVLFTTKSIVFVVFLYFISSHFRTIWLLLYSFSSHDSGRPFFNVLYKILNVYNAKMDSVYEGNMSNVEWV